MPLFIARKKRFLCVVLLLLSSCSTTKVPTIDLSEPGRTQNELDQYASELARYLYPYSVQVLTPEQIIAYKIAEEKLNILRQKAGASAGVGLSTDYLVTIGETNDFFLVDFTLRYKPNDPETYENDLGTDWTTFYNLGDYQPVIVVLSKPNYGLACLGSDASSCSDVVREQISPVQTKRGRAH